MAEEFSSSYGSSTCSKSSSRPLLIDGEVSTRSIEVGNSFLGSIWNACTFEVKLDHFSAPPLGQIGKQEFIFSQPLYPITKLSKQLWM